MAERVLERMHARARAVRTRASVRQWQYRQRHLAAGAWFHLRRVLADARAAFVISTGDADRLCAEGYVSEPAGRQIAPEKVLVFVDEARLHDIGSRSAIPVTLGPELLAAPAVALVPFDEARITRRRS